MFNKVKGTTDFFPKEKDERDYIFGRWKQTAMSFAFRETEAPALESMKLLTRKSGDEIRSQIFVLEKRSNEELGLRFEFTASLARMFIEKQKELAKPVKWFSLGRMWRYEQPQAGRLREFYQFNAEVFGSKKPECDAEIICLAIESLKALGLTKKDFFVNVNNRKLLQGLLLDIVPGNKLVEVLRIIDKRAKISQKEFKDELSFLEKSKIKQLQKLLDIPFDELSSIDMNKETHEGYEEVKNVLEKLDKAFVRFDLSTARGLAYYTGTVFEIFDTDRNYRALCGGGRYDDMIETFGGQETPATGFGMGYSTVLLLLKNKGLLPEFTSGPDYYIATAGGADASKIIANLRRKYSVDYDLNQRNLGNQVKHANSINAKKLIVLGPDELKKGKIKIKDMKTGKEKSVQISQL